MKKTIAIVLMSLLAACTLLSCSDPNSDAIEEAKSAWAKVADAESLKELPAYAEGWFYDRADGVYKYHVGEKVTVITANGDKFDAKAYDGSNVNRYEIKEEGEGSSTAFPDLAE